MKKIFSISLISVLVILSACSTSNSRITHLEGVKLVDLSYSYNSKMPIYPGSLNFKLENEATIDKGYYINNFSTSEHSGTHVDAPSHFSKDGENIDQLKIENLHGPVVVVDIKSQTAKDNDYEITVDDLKTWETENGEIPAGAFVLANSGWGARWTEPKKYVNKDKTGVMRYPGFSESSAEFLIKERNVKGIGIDTLSTDKGSSQTFPEHSKFLSAGKIHLENLANLDQLPTTGAYLIVAPMKIEKGSGAPARVVALVRN